MTAAGGSAPFGAVGLEVGTSAGDRAGAGHERLVLAPFELVLVLGDAHGVSTLGGALVEDLLRLAERCQHVRGRARSFVAIAYADVAQLEEHFTRNQGPRAQPRSVSRLSNVFSSALRRFGTRGRFRMAHRRACESALHSRSERRR